ncbi:hypothetical protein BC679P4_00033 [Bacteroides phage BC679P4]|nr:hypothetical protein BC679P1_00033 [Bacteroides phage BC679P1]WAX05937.1 hypothetical protein BC679P4_00033 [Bacteroides phage BC679P4]
MEEFNKKLKVDRVNQFGHLVKAMAHGTPTEGYAIGDAIKALPDNLQQYLLSEVPDRILRKEHTRRGLNDLTTTPYEGIDELRETYTDVVFKRDPARELCNLLGIKSKFPDILDVIDEVLKLFPERLTRKDLANELYMDEIGMR